MGKILIAEDLKFISVELKNILLSLGYDIFSIIEDDKSLLNIYNSDSVSNIDTIFLGLYLPLSKEFSTSVDLIKKLLSINSDIQIIVISSITDHQLVSKAVLSGAKGYIEKPLTVEKIKKVLK